MIIGTGTIAKDHLPAPDANPAHLSQQHLHVGLLSSKFPQRRGYVPGVHKLCGGLVEQQLEETEVPLADQGDANLGPRQCLTGTNP